MSIVWLASYPKSGNTWCRAFLANLLRDAQEPVSINVFSSIPIASDRNLFEAMTGIPCSYLTIDEIKRLRHKVYQRIASEAKEKTYFKIHDAFSVDGNEDDLIPLDSTWGVLYIVRNPLDVSVSLAYHMGQSLDRTIEALADEEYGIDLKSNRPGAQLPQRVRSWSGHVLSWMDAPGLRRHVVRYEDMMRNPVDVFSSIAHFLKLNRNTESIRRAIRNSSFDELKRQELAHGFKEKSAQSKTFFREGTVGGWRDVLTANQVERIIQEHQEVMCRLRYLTSEGEILC